MLGVISMIFGMMFLVFFIVIGIFVFWVMMLVDCLQRDFDKDVEKIVWTIVIVFLGILGAAIYYFVVKANDAEKPRKKR